MINKETFLRLGKSINDKIQRLQQVDPFIKEKFNNLSIQYLNDGNKHGIRLSESFNFEELLRNNNSLQLQEQFETVNNCIKDTLHKYFRNSNDKNLSLDLSEGHEFADLFEHDKKLCHKYSFSMLTENIDTSDNEKLLHENSVRNIEEYYFKIEKERNENKRIDLAMNSYFIEPMHEGKARFEEFKAELNGEDLTFSPRPDNLPDNKYNEQNDVTSNTKLTSQYNIYDLNNLPKYDGMKDITKENDSNSIFFGG